jgi:hypothetical protein
LAHIWVREVIAVFQQSYVKNPAGKAQTSARISQTHNTLRQEYMKLQYSAMKYSVTDIKYQNLSLQFFFYFSLLTLILLSWRIRWAPNKASKWQMGFKSAFKVLNTHSYPVMVNVLYCSKMCFSTVKCASQQ